MRLGTVYPPKWRRISLHSEPAQKIKFPFISPLWKLYEIAFEHVEIISRNKIY